MLSSPRSPRPTYLGTFLTALRFRIGFEASHCSAMQTHENGLRGQEEDLARSGVTCDRHTPSVDEESTATVNREQDSDHFVYTCVDSDSFNGDSLAMSSRLDEVDSDDQLSTSDGPTDETSEHNPNGTSPSRPTAIEICERCEVLAQSKLVEACVRCKSNDMWAWCRESVKGDIRWPTKLCLLCRFKRKSDSLRHLNQLVKHIQKCYASELRASGNKIKFKSQVDQGESSYGRVRDTAPYHIDSEK